MIGHNCDSGVTITINDSPLADEPIGIPICDDGVKLQERKGNALSFIRRADVTFPLNGLKDDLAEIEYADTWWDVLETENGVLGTGNTATVSPNVATSVNDRQFARTADISLAPLNLDGTVDLENEQTVYRGYIGGVGGGGGPNKGFVSIHDPCKFLNQIKAGVTFNQATVRDILNYVVDEFTENQPYFDSIKIVGDEGKLDQPFIPISPNESTQNDEITFQGRKYGINRPKEFQSNRDSLADITQFIIDNANVRMWFEPSDTVDLQLKVLTDPSQSFDATEGNDTENSVQTINNNVLYEIRPFNALTLKGVDAYTIEAGPLRHDSTLLGDGTYPEATVTYPPLIERSGGRITREEQSNATTEGALEAEGKSKLKQQLDEVSGGTITTALAPSIRPYDTIKATPTCSGINADSVPPITYEVQETAHVFGTDMDHSDIPHTELSVSLNVDPSLIEVETTTKPIQTNKDSDNKPSADETKALNGLTWRVAPAVEGDDQ